MKNSLILRIAVLIFACMLAPLLLLSSINYSLTYNKMRENLVRQAQDNTDKIAYFLMMELDEYFNVSYNIANNSSLVENINKYFYSEYSLQDIYANLLKFSAQSLQKRTKYPFEYTLLLPNKSVVTKYNHSENIDYSAPSEKMFSKAWYHSLSQSNTEKAVVFQDSDYLYSNGASKIYFARSIFLEGQDNAVLLITINKYFIDRLIDNYRSTDLSSIFVFADNKIIANGEQNYVTNQEILQNFLSSDSNTTVKAKGLSQLLHQKTFSFQDTPTVQWRVLVLTPTKIILESIEYIKTTTWALVLICICATALLCWLIKRNVFDRIRILNNAMLQIGKGNANIILPEKKDEIGVLYRGFNEMTIALNESMNKAIREEKGRLSLEIKMLQSQITPHFVRNTLNVVRWMAEMMHADSIARALLNLTKLLDYNIREHPNGVTLRQELENLEEYIYLQQLRYGNNFTYSATIPLELMQIKSLKLLMQPIVENCIMHGFKTNDIMGCIQINACDKNGIVYVSIKDNGSGMSQQSINKILLPYQEDEFIHIGICNVHRRLQNKYGQKFGLEIKQNSPKGLIVTLKIPKEEALHESNDS